MNVLVLDTETTGLDKPFCYDISWVIMDTETGNLIHFSANVVEQVWHNLPLFESAYYKEKRIKYIEMMRRHEAIMDKWGYIMRKLKQDIRTYDIKAVYAYNSDFDDKVITYNCDWFKCINPFDEVPIFDIRGYVHEFLVDSDYKRFCEKHERFTDTGNYSTTAETVFQYVTGETDFEEAHTALNDAEIEAEILFSCVERGAVLGTDYKAKRAIERQQEKVLHVRTAEQTDYYFDYTKIRINKDKTEITLR